MNRREMLHESLRSLSRALPALLGTAGSVAGILKAEDESPPTEPADCFPSGKTAKGAETAPESAARKEHGE